MGKKIKAYKAMDKDMTCRGKQYEVGKMYVEDEADCCNIGMHACTDPFDVLHYYNLASCRLFEVECGGEVSKSVDGSKIACTEMTVTKELSVSDFVEQGVNAVVKKAKNSSATTSYNQVAAATFDDYSTAVTSGLCSTAATSDDYSTAVTSGYKSTATASGDFSIAASTGRESTTAASGYSSTAVANGHESTAATSGCHSTAATFGGRSIAVASGSWSAAKATGKSSIAVANGYKSKASGSIGTYLVLTEYKDKHNLICAKMEKVDGERIKENTLYMLKNGEFVEVDNGENH